MNQTFINFLLSDLDSRWNEISILLQSAKDHEKSNQVLHDAICRSVSVLMVARFEGFYKDLIKNFIEDIKINKKFCDLSSAIQRNYCSIFIDPKSHSNTQNRVTELLIQKFNEVDIVITYEPFLFNRNENPKPQIIETIFDNIGIKKIFEILESSEYENIFQEENSSIEERITRFTEMLDTYSFNFPYAYEDTFFNMKPTSNRKGKSRTLWEEFLDEINRRRHGIAHGSDLGNGHSVESLILTKNKIRCLELALIHVVIEFFGTASCAAEHSK
ncbi:MAE_28990/MAE_18760 family HEPN-like nuclease [Acinetobacter pittii]|uniref:MAE_28990/MAE_18760 family HEPN-like nuclease n=1 Tax=Acinetobacter TaxID=469 RepID=UPI00326012D6